MVLMFCEKQNPLQEDNMGEATQSRNITIEFDCQFRVDIQKSDFSSIMKAFLILLPQLLEDFSKKHLSVSVNMKWPWLRSRSLAHVVVMTQYFRSPIDNATKILCY